MNIKQLTFASVLSILSFESFASMNISEYQYRAIIGSQPHSRCNTFPVPSNWQQYIDDALYRGLITLRAANWGRANGFYPIIDMFRREVGAVCSAGKP
ncbi:MULTISPECIES: hypothetical protein [Pseudoalteromonas]|uniref:Uncharacterized protein n=1 Tax=Pseudoalteromonas luteoviolacea (strain 2ta16) TaxID=1353533 RepID=V4HN07_PSEL2|nr:MULTISPECIES: hypothetical protein [Pseudoalteromonas]ESP92215.1 hypothetical protein PL2TA16_05052 [Pseudoalteromonas luteoviolacea 2ta16]KZN29323.1 hypothetical protein N483_07765 [Pseudoalteromonas luteoviolacea NCIMB 1944]MCG7549347.1 hypothetical protein [Pseudoalteromonas sp. Of7M-16]